MKATAWPGGIMKVPARADIRYLVGMDCIENLRVAINEFASSGHSPVLKVPAIAKQWLKKPNKGYQMATR
jgi:hypothetical protein